MFRTDPSIPHLASSPLVWGKPVAQADQVVYGLTGRGLDATWGMEVADQLAALSPQAARAVQHCCWVFPQAPACRWYPGRFAHPLEANQPALDHAAAMLTSHLTDLTECGIRLDQIILFGFSQGACLLAHLLLTSQHPLPTRAFIHSGSYLGPDQTPVPRTDLSWLQAVVTGDQFDPLIPAERVAQTARHLKACRAQVDYVCRPSGGHRITPADLDLLLVLITHGTSSPEQG